MATIQEIKEALLKIPEEPKELRREIYNLVDPDGASKHCQDSPDTFLRLLAENWNNLEPPVCHKLELRTEQAKSVKATVDAAATAKCSAIVAIISAAIAFLALCFSQ